MTDQRFSCINTIQHACLKTGAMDARTLKDAIFKLHTRNFGKITEIIIERTQHLSESHSLFHDLFSNQLGLRYEVKFSRVQQKTPKIQKEKAIESILAIAQAQRNVSFAEIDKHQFDCNIQQIKKNEFDLLIYGLMFDDIVLIFQIPNSSINEDVGYSNKQHKGNEGEGQFHITEKNIAIHLENFLISKLTYEQLLKILQ